MAIFNYPYASLHCKYLFLYVHTSLEPVPACNNKLGPGKFGSQLYQRLSNVFKTNESKTVETVLI